MPSSVAATTTQRREVSSTGTGNGKNVVGSIHHTPTKWKHTTHKHHDSGNATLWPLPVNVTNSSTSNNSTTPLVYNGTDLLPLNDTEFLPGNNTFSETNSSEVPGSLSANATEGAGNGTVAINATATECDGGEGNSTIPVLCENVTKTKASTPASNSTNDSMMKVTSHDTTADSVNNTLTNMTTTETTHLDNSSDLIIATNITDLMTNETSNEIIDVVNSTLANETTSRTPVSVNSTEFLNGTNVTVVISANASNAANAITPTDNSTAVTVPCHVNSIVQNCTNGTTADGLPCQTNATDAANGTWVYNCTNLTKSTLHLGTSTSKHKKTLNIHHPPKPGGKKHHPHLWNHTSPSRPNSSASPSGTHNFTLYSGVILLGFALLLLAGRTLGRRARARRMQYRGFDSDLTLEMSTSSPKARIRGEDNGGGGNVGYKVEEAPGQWSYRAPSYNNEGTEGTFT